MKQAPIPSETSEYSKVKHSRKKSANDIRNNFFILFLFSIDLFFSSPPPAMSLRLSKIKTESVGISLPGLEMIDVRDGSNLVSFNHQITFERFSDLPEAIQKIFLSMVDRSSSLNASPEAPVKSVPNPAPKFSWAQIAAKTVTHTQPAALKSLVPAREALPTALKPKIAAFHGITNPGNICYANSVLQALLHLPSFRNLVLSHAESHMLPPSSVIQTL